MKCFDFSRYSSTLCFIAGLLFSLQLNAQHNKLKKIKTLSFHEKTWVIFHPFVAGKALRISENVRYIAEKMSSDTRLDGISNGGTLDAFRHVFWMASLSQQIRWRKAYKLGKAHEKGNKADYRKKRNEEGYLPDAVSCEMDLWNNDVGIEIGRRSRNIPENELKHLALEAVIKGKCRIVKMNTEGNFLDESGKIIPLDEWQGKWENGRCLVGSDWKFEK